MRWLVTGGAGYIGSHVVALLLESGRQVCVLDDLSTGDAGRVPAEVPLMLAPLTDVKAVGRVLEEAEFFGVIHLAGRKSVVESIQEPHRYYRDNVEGTRTLLQAMADHGVSRLVFSSTAAVYGEVSSELVREDHAPRPISPYGRSKLAAEWLIGDAAFAGGLEYVSLRYFNVAGAGRARLRDQTRSGLIPGAMDAVLARHRPTVFGTDHPTADGSCVRDYVHVSDVATAHLRVVEGLEAGAVGGEVFNVGRGNGYSVLEVMAMIEGVTGLRVDPVVGPRRGGDAAQVVADVRRIERALGWRARHDLQDMVTSEWLAAQAGSST